MQASEIATKPVKVGHVSRLRLVDPEQLKAARRGSFLFSLGVVVGLFALLAGRVQWWKVGGAQLLPSGRYGLIAAALLCVLGLVVVRFRIRMLRMSLDAFGCALIAVFFTDWICRGYSLFQGPYIRGELIIGFVVAGMALYFNARWIWATALFLSIAMLFHTLFVEANGRLIFSDDNATNLYRLMLLKDNFPNIPFYSPFWNGGIDERYFFATGTLNLFFLAAPLIYAFKIVDVYNVIVGGLLFLVTPGATFAAARLYGFSLRGASIAGLLALSTSAIWYRWALAFGTLGFLTSTALLPLVIALGVRVVDPKLRLSWYHALFFVVTFTLAIFWSPAGIVCLPLIGFGAARILTLWRRRYVLPICIVLLAINLPWIGMFWSVSKVSSFLGADTAVTQSIRAEPTEAQIGSYDEKDPGRRFKHRPGTITLKGSLAAVQSVANAFHPVIIFLGIAGIMCLSGTIQGVFATTSIWLLILGAVLVPLKPQLELDRMLVVLGLFACVPAARACELMFSRASRLRSGIFRRGVAAATGAFVLIGPYTAGAFVGNRTTQQYQFARPYVSELTEVVKLNAEGGRVIYSGSVIHQMSGGHLAPLPYWSKIPMIASSQLHNLWWYKQVFPREYIADKIEGIERYLDLYNVSLVFAHEPNWRKRFQGHPDKFVEIWRGGPFTLFKRRGFLSNYFLQGGGEVIDQTTSTVTFRLDTKDAVIKFNYLPFVEVPGCQVGPHPVSESVNLIRLSDCPVNSLLTLRSVDPWRRFKMQVLQ